MDGAKQQPSEEQTEEKSVTKGVGLSRGKERDSRETGKEQLSKGKRKRRAKAMNV